jgi:hypothetical protein
VISIPDNENLIIHFGYKPLGGDGSSNPESFAQFLQSDRAKDILTRQGYLP